MKSNRSKHTLALLFSLFLMGSIASAQTSHARLDSLQRTAALCRQPKVPPDSQYQSLWRCSKLCRDYANLYKKLDLPKWKDTCEHFGATAMHMAEKAIALSPDRPEGYYFYAVAVGCYADGVSILTALRQGLKDKTHNSLKKAYDADKRFDDAGPVFALGRFWAVVPWPYRDRKKALEYYREYQRLTTYTIHKYSRTLQVAELLIQLGKKHDPEARRILEDALKSPREHIRKKAIALLEEIE